MGVILLAVIIVGFYFVMSKPAPQPTANAVQSPQTVNQKVKLADTKYGKDSYLISSETLSPEAQTAISGFNISRVVNPDGSINMVLIALNPEYQNQNYHLAPGQSLYFIETYAGDDNPPKGEGPSLMDDKAVIVDQDGYPVSPLPAR